MKFAGLGLLSCLLGVILIPCLVILPWQKENISKKDLSLGGKEISVYNHKTGADETMPTEEYIARIIAGEMPASFHIEALKAQAVAARTYSFKKVQSGYFPKEHKNSPVCTNYAHCCAYLSLEEAVQKWGETQAQEYMEIYKRAVFETKDIVMSYDDNLISAVFHSTSSGKTENAADVWGTDYPYLRSIESDGDQFSPSYKSVSSVPYKDFISILKKDNPSFDENNAVLGEVIRTQGGGVSEIMIGGVFFSGIKIRSLFSIKSTNFELKLEDNMAVFYVTGYGHGVGMSQYGANYMAQTGASYEDILKKYYSGITLETIK